MGISSRIISVYATKNETNPELKIFVSLPTLMVRLRSPVSISQKLKFNILFLVELSMSFSESLPYFLFVASHNDEISQQMPSIFYQMTCPNTIQCPDNFKCAQRVHADIRWVLGTLGPV